MSISSTINQAIRIAKVNLGDAVSVAEYRRAVSSTYNTTTGQNEIVWESVNIEYVPDKFDFNELQSGAYEESDVKITVFNPDNTLVFKTKEIVVIGGQELKVYRALPSKMGAFTPVWTLVLRA